MQWMGIHSDVENKMVFTDHPTGKDCWCTAHRTPDEACDQCRPASDPWCETMTRLTPDVWGGLHKG
jgi:hypothetical protein